MAEQSELPPPRPTVLVWVDGWLPYSQTFVRDHVQGLTRWRTVSAGLFREPAGIPVPANYLAFSSARWARAKRFMFTLIARRGFRRFCESQDIRLIHAHFGGGGARMASLARRMGTPLLVTMHGNDVLTQPQRPGLAGWHARRGLSMAFQQADYIIAPSQYLARAVLDLGAPPNKTVVHYLGVPVPPDPPPPLEGRDGVLYVGRLVDYKGVLDLIAAMAALPIVLRSVPVTIIGDGPLRTAAERAAADAGIQARFVGAIESPGVADAMRGARVLCAPSRTGTDRQTESFGLVFAEAAMHGLPVCAYRSAGVVESAPDGVAGLLCKPGCIDQLVVNLARLLTDDELWKRLSGKGHAHARMAFNQRERNHALERAYDTVVAGGNRHDILAALANTGR